MAFPSWGLVLRLNLVDLVKSGQGTGSLLGSLSQSGGSVGLEELGRRLAEALNGLVDGINWYQLGQALGAGLNLALQFLTEFIYTFAPITRPMASQSISPIESLIAL